MKGEIEEKGLTNRDIAIWAHQSPQSWGGGWMGIRLVNQPTLRQGDYCGSSRAQCHHEGPYKAKKGGKRGRTRETAAWGRLCPMLLPVETEEESPSKKAGVLWKMERARKWISPLEPPGGDRPADTLILVQWDFRGPSDLQNCKIINVCLSITTNKCMTNLDRVLKGRDITLATKVCVVKAMVLPGVMYGCECWTVKKAGNWRNDAFELWCWRSS